MSLTVQPITGGQSLPLGYPYVLVSQGQSLTSAQQAQGRANLGINGTGGGGGGFNPGKEDSVFFDIASFTVSASNGIVLLTNGRVGLTSYGDIVAISGDKGIEIGDGYGGAIKLTGAIQINGVALDTYINNRIASYVNNSNILTQANIDKYAVISIQSHTGRITLGSGLSISSGGQMTASGGGGGGNLASFQGDLCLRNAQGTLVLRNDASTGYETVLAGNQITIEFYGTDWGGIRVGRADQEGGTMVPYIHGYGYGNWGEDIVHIGDQYGVSQLILESQQGSTSSVGAI